MTALVITAGVLLFAFLLLSIPIRLKLGFQQEFTLALHYAFLRFRLLPSKEQPTETEDEQPTDTSAWDSLGKIKQSLKRNGAMGFLKALFELVKIVAESSKKLLKHVKLKSFDLYLCLGTEGDPGDAAMRYGEISGAVYSACGMLFGLMPCRKKGVTVDLNYSVPDDTVDFSAVISISPIFLLKEGISLLLKGLPLFKKFIGSSADSENKERASQTREQGEHQ